jgi:cobalt-zinc-cadmium efflux system protein
MPGGGGDDAFLEQATRALHETFGIEHTTLQVVRVPFAVGCAEARPGGRPP